MADQAPAVQLKQQGKTMQEETTQKEPVHVETEPEVKDRISRGSLTVWCLGRTWHFFGIYWEILFAIFWATFLAIFLALYDSSEVRCTYVVMLVAGYWVTECLPIGMSSLMPVFLLPLLGIMNSQDTCRCYFNDTIMVFVSGMVLAIATEHCNLHLRIALIVMKIVGCSHAKLLGGLCTVTTFISMWIANAATAAIMVPIVLAVLYELESQGIGKVFYEQNADPENPEAELERTPTNITKAYLFAAAYSTTFGGTGTLIGTPTNLVLKGIYENIFPQAQPITFGIWMAGCFPQMSLNSFILWIYLRVAFLGYLRPRSKDAEMAKIGDEGEKVANEVIRVKLKNLGPMSFHEIAVGTLFLMCIFLWIFRAPGFVWGWSQFLTDIPVTDGTPGAFICLLMFLIPKEPNFINVCSRDPEKRWNIWTSEGLITWAVINSKMPWGLILLLGGGFAISSATRSSGLALYIGHALEPLKYLPAPVMLAVILTFVNTLTEFTSNVGTANIILPVVAHMCVAMRIHPLYVMVPVAVMCSYSFRLPISTPPNAIISIAGNLKTGTVLMAGCFPAFYSLIIQIIIFPTWGSFIFNIHEFPDWADN